MTTFDEVCELPLTRSTAGSRAVLMHQREKANPELGSGFGVGVIDLRHCCEARGVSFDDLNGIAAAFFDLD